VTIGQGVVVAAAPAHPGSNEMLDVLVQQSAACGLSHASETIHAALWHRTGRSRLAVLPPDHPVVPQSDCSKSAQREVFDVD